MVYYDISISVFYIYASSKCFQSNSSPSEDYLEKCNCPIECQTDEYTYIHSIGDIFNPKHKNQTRLLIYYGELRETMISEEKKIEITDHIYFTLTYAYLIIFHN